MSKFTKAIEKFKKTVEESTVRLHKNVALDLLRFTVKKTPVDTGLLRSNWQLGLNRPIKKQVGKVEVSKGGKKRVAGAKVDNGSNISGLKIGDTIFMTNPVKYAPYVEYGSSTNKPVAMLSRSVEDVRSKYK